MYIHICIIGRYYGENKLITDKSIVFFARGPAGWGVGVWPPPT